MGKERIGAAYVTVMVTGDVAACKAAVEAGAAALQNVGGKLILAHMIARPHDELASLLPQRARAGVDLLFPYYIYATQGWERCTDPHGFQYGLS